VTAPELPLSAAGTSSTASLLHRLLGYTLSRGASEAMLAVRGVLLAILLGPAAFGTWALLRMIMRYSTLSAFSVYRGLELELMQRREGKESTGTPRAAEAALGFVLLISGSIAGLALAASILVTQEELRVLLRAFAFAGVAEAVYGYALVCTRIGGDLRRYSLLESGTSALHVLCAVGLAWHWGLSGAVTGLVIANLLGLALATRWVDFRPALAWAPVRRMLQVGVPVVLTMAVSILLSTADRWVIALWGGTTMLGYYAFAGSVTTVPATLAIVVRTVVFPQVYGQASAAGAASALRNHLESVLLPFARLVPPLLGALSLVLAPLVALTLPQYTEAIAPARVFLLAGAAMGLINIASIGAVAAGQQRRLPLYAALALALTFVVSVLTLITGGGLGSVAAATFMGHLLFAALVLRLNIREIGLPGAERLVATLLLPLVWCTAAVTLTSTVFAGLEPDSAMKGLGLYLLLLIPLAPQWMEEWSRLRAPVRKELTSRAKKS
jgi:O-antigen/teichoic acid export membrane protein